MDTITTAATTYTPPGTSVVHNAQVSLTDRSPASVVHVVQYDNTLPIVAVALTANGQAYTVPSGAAVNVRMKKPDGTYVYNPALGVSKNAQTAYIAVTLQMAAASGKASPIVEIVVDGSVAATGTFTMIIDENPVPESAIESTDEFLTIQQILVQVQAAAKIVSDNEVGIQYIADNQEEISAVAANGESITTVGQSIGNVNAVATNITDVQTAAQNIEAIQNAPTAAESAAASAALSESWAVGGTGTREGEDTNNAKYYSEQAQQVSQGAVGYYETGEALKAAHPTGQPGNWAIVGSTDTIWVWDTESSGWLDTSQNMNLSDYYTKTESDNRYAKASELAGVMERMLPVGSIVEWSPVDGDITDLSTPAKVAAYYGFGTWEAYAPGRVLAAVTDGHTVGSQVGAETHVVTKSEMPAHEHGIHGWSWGVPGGGEQQFAITKPYDSVDNYEGTTKSEGGGQAMSLMQPTQYVYRWQRIE